MATTRNNARDVIASAQEPVVDDELDRPPAFSDEALALRFADRHSNELRYVAAWGQWFVYDRAVWRADDTIHAFDMARRICREAAVECNQPNTAKAIASAKTVAAIERLAKADRRLAATVSQWDAEIWTLNTPDGAVDLRTGEVRPQRLDDFATKITAVGPSASAKCPVWRRFLKRITDGDADLERYLQKVAGYALTGSTSEQCLFFGYGLGANGKGTLLHTLAGILGGYHSATPVETFTASPVDRHPTELADLRGARLVTATETEEGRRWAESRIKMLTGDDPVKARFMRQDFFTYQPQFKLFITGNHKPGLRSVDEAIRRRFNLIPFTVTIPKAERDLHLEDKLRTEWPGILRWMIDGCLDWQRDGLTSPAAVAAATSEYLEGEDAFSLWLEDCCSRDSNGWTKNGVLFASWKRWAEAANEFVGSQKRFSQKLEEHGFRPHAGHDGRGFLGIKIADREL